jgi:hypothetical protein
MQRHDQETVADTLSSAVPLNSCKVVRRAMFWENEWKYWLADVKEPVKLPVIFMDFERQLYNLLRVTLTQMISDKVTV